VSTKGTFHPEGHGCSTIASCPSQSACCSYCGNQAHHGANRAVAAEAICASTLAEGSLNRTWLWAVCVDCERCFTEIHDGSLGSAAAWLRSFKGTAFFMSSGCFGATHGSRGELLLKALKLPCGPTERSHWRPSHPQTGWPCADFQAEWSGRPYVFRQGELIRLFSHGRHVRHRGWVRVEAPMRESPNDYVTHTKESIR